MGAEKSMVDSNQVKSIEQNRVSSQASIHITVTSYSSDFDKINIVCVCFHEFHLRQDLPVVQIGLFIPTWGLDEILRKLQGWELLLLLAWETQTLQL